MNAQRQVIVGLPLAGSARAATAAVRTVVFVVARDLNAFRQRFVSDRTAAETDFNRDGVTNGFDLDLLRAEILRGAAGTPCP